MVPELELAWFAGFVDGEGSLFLCKAKKYRFISPLFSLGNTNLRAMETSVRIVSQITGKRCECKTIRRQSAKGSYRPLYLLRLKRRADIIEVCKALLPYLVIKREQANLMIEYIRFASSGRNYRRQGLTELHVQMHREMAELNKRFAPGEWDREFQARDLTPGSAKADEGKVRTARRRAEAAETTARLLPFGKVS